MSGSDSTFDELYRGNLPDLVKIATAVLSDHDRAQEFAQDVFVIYLVHREKVQNHPNIKAWLRRVLNNRIKTELQRARYRLEVPLGPEHEHYAAVSDQPFPDLRDRLPAGLSQAEQEILILFYEEELSHEEIAAKLGITPSASQGRLYRARKKYIALMRAPDEN